MSTCAAFFTSDHANNDMNDVPCSGITEQKVEQELDVVTNTKTKQEYDTFDPTQRESMTNKCDIIIVVEAPNNISTENLTKTDCKMRNDDIANSPESYTGLTHHTPGQGEVLHNGKRHVDFESIKSIESQKSEDESQTISEEETDSYGDKVNDGWNEERHEISVNSSVCSHSQISFPINNRSYKSNRVWQNKSLFDNLERTVETSIRQFAISSSIFLENDKAVESFQKMVKMCFASMATVFSSLPKNIHSPQGDFCNIIEGDTNMCRPETIMNDVFQTEVDEDSIGEASLQSSVSHEEDSIVSSRSFSHAHREKLQPIKPVKSEKFLDKLERERRYSSKSIQDHNKCATANTSSNSTNSVCDSEAVVESNTDLEPYEFHRPRVSLSAVKMLWKRILVSRSYESAFKIKDDEFITNEDGNKKIVTDRTVDVLMDHILDALINNLSFVDVIQNVEEPSPPSLFNMETNIEADDDDDGNVFLENDDEMQNGLFHYNKTEKHDGGEHNEIYIRISHDIHLLYGNYIAQNQPSIFNPASLNLKNELPKNRSLDKDDDTWNPEIELNADMAAACLECINEASSNSSTSSNYFSFTQNLSMHDLVKYKYAIEMLPWHLMRSLKYEEAADTLTDASFVKSRVLVLNVMDATTIHIADVEELKVRLTACVTQSERLQVDINEVFVSSYRLISSIFHCENVQIGNHQQDKHTKISFVEHISNTLVNNDIAISRSLHCLGNSLSNHMECPDAVKLYSRALIQFEDTLNTLHKSKQLSEGNLENSYKVAEIADRIKFYMAETLHKMAYLHALQSQNIEAMLCCERALSVFSSQCTKSHTKGVAKTLVSLGILHFNKDEYDYSLTCFDESLSLYRMLKEDDCYADEIGDILQWMGSIWRQKGFPREALDLFTQALYDKVVVKGKDDPDVGLIQQSLGIVSDDLKDYSKALEFFFEALRIRRATLKLSWTELSSDIYLDKENKEIVLSQEKAVAETLECLGNSFNAKQDYTKSFNCFVESAMIHRSHLLEMVSDDILIMTSDLTNLMAKSSEDTVALSSYHTAFSLALEMGNLVLATEYNKSSFDLEKKIQLEEQMSDILNDIGTIYGARYSSALEDTDLDDEYLNKQREVYRFKAKQYFEDSIIMRRRLIKTMSEGMETVNHISEDHDQVAIAFSFYEIGKLFAKPVMKKRHEKSDIDKITLKEVNVAVTYFEEASKIMLKKIDLSDNPEVASVEDDPLTARLLRMPTLFEEMLQLMAVMYRKLDLYDKAMECYNEVSILLTRMELNEDECASGKSILSNQKEKVAFSSHSIGDILFDTGEYARALESYNEALQLRRLTGGESLEVADTLCCKGVVFLKMKNWDQAILSYDEALRIRVDQLPKDDVEIAECFHNIAKAYEGLQKLDQALEYYKKAQRIVSGSTSDITTDAADILFDLGHVVILKGKFAESLCSTPPTDEEISLALTCLALSLDKYRREFGENALEVGKTQNLLGVIYAKYREYSKAVTSYEDALRIFRNAPLDQSILVAKTLNLLGHVHLQSESWEEEKLIQYFVLALQIFEDKKETGTEDYASALLNKGSAHVVLGM